MTRSQERIDAELDSASPSTVDVDAITGRLRMLVRAQRAGVATAADFAAAALVTGIGVLQQAGGVRSPDVMAYPSPSASPTRDPQLAEVTRLISQEQLIPAGVLPDARFPQDDTTGAALGFVDRGGYFPATAKISDGKGTGSLRVITGDLTTACGSAECPGDLAPRDVKLSCDTVPGLDGARVMRLTMTRDRFVRYVICLPRPDGKGVAVETTNGATKDNTELRSTPPLTTDQAFSVARRPAFATTPDPPRCVDHEPCSDRHAAARGFMITPDRDEDPEPNLQEAQAASPTRQGRPATIPQALTYEQIRGSTTADRYEQAPRPTDLTLPTSDQSQATRARRKFVGKPTNDFLENQ